MSFRIALVAIALTFFFGCAPKHISTPQSQGVSVTADSDKKLMEEAQQLHKNFVVAFNAGDTRNLESLYSKSSGVVLYPPGEAVAQGPAAVSKSLTTFRGDMPGVKLNYVSENFKVYPDAVVAWGLWELRMPVAKKGKTAILKGRYTQLMVKEDGKLVLLVDHSSSHFSRGQKLLGTSNVQVKKKGGTKVKNH